MEISLTPWKIREFRRDDVDALVKYANNRRVSRNHRDMFPYPYDREAGEAWIAESLEQVPPTRFAIASEQELIGGISLILQSDVQRHTAEIGYWLGEPFWRQGIATRAVRAMTQYGFDQFDLECIYAGVFEWNPASARVLEKAGFTFEGRLRHRVTKEDQTLDLLMYSILRSEKDRDSS